MKPDRYKSQIILVDPHYFGFDKEGCQQDINLTSTNIWLATCRFIIKDNIEDLSVSSSINYSWQKQAVRQLLDHLIDEINLDELDKNIRFDKVWLDETKYPYQIQPLGYHVSFSHSKDRVACAISRSHPIGVDVELRNIPFKIAQRFYNRLETDWLETLDSNSQQQATNLMWMLKEANIKKISNQHNPISLIRGLKQNVIMPTVHLLKSISNSKPLNYCTINNIYTYPEQKKSKAKDNYKYIYIPLFNLAIAF